MRLKLRLVILFALLVSTTTWGQGESELRSKANALFIKESYSDATKIYLQLLSLNPKDVDLNFRYGVCLLHNSDNKSDAVRYLNFVVKENPSWTDAFYFLGKAYHLGYNFEQARINYSLYIQKAGPKERYVLEAKRNLQMSSNGEKLLSNITEIHVKEKLEISKDNFYRGYTLDDVGGSLIQAVDFQSKVDKKKGHKPVVHILPSSDLIYFSSYGDGDHLDIYVIRRLPDGKYGVAQRIQGEVNTLQDEDFPYMHPNGKELFFCSKGHNSMGGYDIFRATYDPENNQFIAINNVDFAISSPDDDLLYVVDKDYKNAYFASNRQAQNGMISLYKVAVDRFPSELVILKGSFNSKINKDFKQIFIDVFDDQTNRKIGRFQTNELGNYVIVLPRGGKYQFKTSSNQFSGSFSQLVEIPYLDVVKPLRQYAEHLNQDNGATILFVNAFDELIENSTEVIAEALKLRGNLTPNDSPMVKEVISTSKGSISKAAQQVGLPDWGANALFTHIDDLGSRYINETEKNTNLNDIQNAVVYGELQKIEKIDLQLVNLAQQLNEAPTNTQERNIQERINQLNDQRAESIKWTNLLEDSRLKVQQLYKGNFINSEITDEEIHQMIKDLHWAKGQSDDAFMNSLIRYEKEIRLINKDPNSIYKIVLEEKAILDKKLDQFTGQEKTTKERLQELNSQLVRLNEALENTKTKQKSSVENQIERVTNEVFELTSNLKLLNKQRLNLDAKQDSIVQLIQVIGKIEQFKGTPVSSQMLSTAQFGFKNSVVSKGEINVLSGRVSSTNSKNAQDNSDEVVFIDEKRTNLPKKEEQPNLGELTKNTISNSEGNIPNNLMINEISSENKVNNIENNFSNGKSGVTKEVEKTPITINEPSGRKDMKSLEVRTLDSEKQRDITSELQNPNSISSSIEDKGGSNLTQNRSLTPKIDHQTEMVSTEVLKNDSSLNASVEGNKTNKVHEVLNNYAFILDLPSELVAYIKEFDNYYFSRVEKLEQRKLNASEQRVLIDLHRKFLDKIEEEQSKITFQERRPKINEELKLLETLNQKLTQSIQYLNKQLSDEEDEIEKSPSKKVILAKETDTQSNSSSFNSNQLEESTGFKENINRNVDNVEKSKDVNVTLPILKQDEKGNGNAIDSNIHDSVIKDERETETQNKARKIDNSAMFSQPRISRSPEMMELEQSIHLLSSQISIKKDELHQTADKKEKRTILASIQSLESEMDGQITTLNELNFDLLFDKNRYYSESELSEIEKKYLQLIDETNGTYHTTNDKVKKRSLSEKRLDLLEELVDWTDYQKQVDYLEIARRESVSLISTKELEFITKYLVLKQADLENLINVNDRLDAKKKVDKQKQYDTGILLSNILLENQVLQQFVKSKLIQENIFVFPSKENSVAPSYPEEYKILASEEYETFALLKVREQELEYAINVLSIQLNNARAKAQHLFFDQSINDSFKVVLNEISKLEEIRSRKMEEKIGLSKELAGVTPKDSSITAFFNNLVQRGLNPIIHKQLQSDLIEIGENGIQFLNDSNSERKELTLSTAKGLVYRVQVGAFKNQIPPHIFSEFSPVTTELIPNSSIKRYIAGFFSSIKMAEHAKQQILSLGYTDAFIVAYCDGERVGIQKAKELEAEGSCSVGYLENISFEINKEIREKAIKIERDQVDFTKIKQFDYNKGEGMVKADPFEEYEGLFFTVQVGVYNRPTAPERFHNQKPLYTFRAENGQIRYSVGVFTDLLAARTKEKELRILGLKDAYVVAYYKGQRITLAQALDLIDSGVKPSFGKRNGATIVLNETISIVKEEIPIFKSVQKSVVQLEKEYIQLISIDSFVTIPVDFLDRFRSKSYFYFDQGDGRVKSQIVQKQHYLADMESLRKFFYIESNQDLLLKDLGNAFVSITLDKEKIPSNLADFLLRIPNRFELKELENGIEILIFVLSEEDLQRIDNGVKLLGYSSKMISKKQR